MTTSKIKKKARGFTKTYSKRSSSRAQKKDLEDAFNKIVIDLTSPRKKDITKTLTKLQAKVRGNQTRRNFSKTKAKLLKDKEERFKKSIGPQFYKTLQEIPTPILEKILDNIFKNSNISQDTSDLKIFLIASIKTSKIIESLNVTLDMIHQINKKIFRLLDEYKEYLGFIIMNAGNHGSSDDEDEIEAKHDNYLHTVHSYRPKMRKISEILNYILTFREKIIKHLVIIFNLVKDPNLKDANNKLIEEFIENININWYEELNKCTEEGIPYTHGKVLYTEIIHKLEDFKKNSPNMIKKAEVSFEMLFKNKFVLTLNNDKIVNEFERNNKEIVMQYYEYEEYLVSIKAKPRKTGRESDPRRRSSRK